MSENGSGPEPKVIEGPGRYKVFQTPDGGWLIARAGPLCERCENCGCGEQGDPVVLPPMVVQMATQAGRGRLMAALKAAKGMRSGR